MPIRVRAHFDFTDERTNPWHDVLRGDHYQDINASPQCPHWINDKVQLALKSICVIEGLIERVISDKVRRLIFIAKYVCTAHHGVSTSAKRRLEEKTDRR